MSELRLPRKALTRFDLPPVCLATGAVDGVTYHKTRFVFVPLWARLSVAFCGLIGVILVLVSTQRADAEVPFTEEAFAVWKRAKMVTVALVLGSLVPLVGGLLLMDSTLLVGIVAFLAVLVGAVVYSQTVLKGLGPICKSIDADSIVLVVPSEAAADAINKRLGLGPDGTAPALAPVPPGDKYDQQLEAELDRM